MRVRTDVDSGETILETMGELHLEVIKDRLRRNYGLDAFFGPLQVAARLLLVVKRFYYLSHPPILVMILLCSNCGPNLS